MLPKKKKKKKRINNEIREYLKTNNNTNIASKDLWDTVKELRGMCKEYGPSQRKKKNLKESFLNDKTSFEKVTYAHIHI